MEVKGNFSYVATVPVWAILAYNYFLLGGNEGAFGPLLITYILTPVAVFLTVLFIVKPYFSGKKVQPVAHIGHTYYFNVSALTILGLMLTVYASVILFFYNNQVVPFEKVLPILLKNFSISIAGFIMIVLLVRTIKK